MGPSIKYITRKGEGGGGGISVSVTKQCVTRGGGGGGVHIGQKSVTYFKDSPYAPGVYNQMSRATSPLDHRVFAKERNALKCQSK